MEISLRKALARQNGQERDTYTCFQEKHLKGFSRLVLERGFFFLLITRGTALLTDAHGEHPLHTKDLILLTPGMTENLEGMSAHFQFSGLCIFPDYFDRLTDGGTFYNQYTKYLHTHDFSPIRLDRQDYESLRRIFPLFDRYEDFSGAYHTGIVRHLCSLFLRSSPMSSPATTTCPLLTSNGRTKYSASSRNSRSSITNRTAISPSMRIGSMYPPLTSRASSRKQQDIRLISCCPNSSVPMPKNGWKARTRM